MQRKCHGLLMAKLHPTVAILNLDIYLAQPQEDELFLLGAFGDFVLQQLCVFSYLSSFFCGLSIGQLCFQCGISLEEAGSSLILFLEILKEVGPLVQELLERPNIQAHGRKGFGIAGREHLRSLVGGPAIPACLSEVGRKLE